MTDEDIDRAIDEVQFHLSDPDAQKISIEISRTTALLFVDFLRWRDPDMPPAPLCKALGPLPPAIADMMTNDKLNRLNDLIREAKQAADTIGPAAILLQRMARRSETP